MSTNKVGALVADEQALRERLAEVERTDVHDRPDKLPIVVKNNTSEGVE